MRGTLLKISPHGRLTAQDIDGPPTLEMLKDGIGGGYIAPVPYFTSIMHEGELRECRAFCDEDGKRKQLAMNVEATKLWDIAMRAATRCGCSPDFLVGQVVVVMGDSEFMEAL
jgi:hypothetical protein